jgi:hypothetical protein
MIDSLPGGPEGQILGARNETKQRHKIQQSLVRFIESLQVVVGPFLFSIVMLPHVPASKYITPYFHLMKCAKSMMHSGKYA